ncbi:hypothetical protein ACFWYW_58710 [Nonomuraea sp. NPDC059023]|uniref:DUF7167 family protein n=1 Tax=unclassified Nonomuraea TaxID=2593643 RepID=UPI0036925582
MSSEETVKVEANLCMSSQGVSLSDEIDTGLTREQWDALSEDEQEEHVKPFVEDWFENLVQYGWNEIAE